MPCFAIRVVGQPGYRFGFLELHALLSCCQKQKSPARFPPGLPTKLPDCTFSHESRYKSTMPICGSGTVFRKLVFDSEVRIRVAARLANFGIGTLN
jgi:hypothetical protein